jgi:hypothetical protein
VEPDNLPHSSQIRTAFLGKLAAGRDPRDYMDSQLRSVADHLHAAVSRQRNNKTNSAAISAIEKAQASSEGATTEGWEQNSFMTPLDSRAAKLRTKE